MKRMVLVVAFLTTVPLLAVARNEEDSVRKALAAYDEAVAKKDVQTVRSLLAPELLLYERSVRNDGVDDAFENHLKPEILEADGLQLSFSDLRVTANSGLALVTRQYQVKRVFQGKTIDFTGNETQVWKQTDARWKIIHIHYSHACARPKTTP